MSQGNLLLIFEGAKQKGHLTLISSPVKGVCEIVFGISSLTLFEGWGVETGSCYYMAQASLESPLPLLPVC